MRGRLPRDGSGLAAFVPARGPSPRTALVAVFVAGAAIRLALLPTDGYPPDQAQFVTWIHGIANLPFGQAYRLDLSFPPVMAYLFGIIGAVDPAFRTAVGAPDAWMRVAIKLAPSVADLGLAAGLAFAFRDRPRWAVIAAACALLHPAVPFVSAWWGQFESMYVLGALVAYLCAASGRPHLAAAAMAVSLMTKPQALPLLVPFAAWLIGRHGIRVAVSAGAVFAAVAVVVWLPFLPDGPGQYLANLGRFQNDIYGVITLHAWNAWWILQQSVPGGGLILDSNAVAGPVTLRVIGLVLAGLAELVVFVVVLRQPTARQLALGLACATLVAFSLLTTMHERYSYPALVFLVLLIDDRRVRWTWLALGVLVMLNLWDAVPTLPALPPGIADGGPFGLVGGIGMLAVTLACVYLLVRGEPEEPLLEEPVTLAVAA